MVGSYTRGRGPGQGVTMTPRGGLDRGGMGAGGRRRARSGALLHEYPLRVGRFGQPFSSPQEPHYRDAVRCEKAAEGRRIAAARWARAISVASSISTIEKLREWSAH